MRQTNKFKENNQPGRLSSYARQLIPDEAEIVFLFKEDFDGDGLEEAVIGYTLYGEYSAPCLYVLQVKTSPDGCNQARILSTAEDAKGFFITEGAGAYEAAYTADTTGNGLPELILSLTAEDGGFLTPYIIRWQHGKPIPFFTTHEAFAHGRMHVQDIDSDGVYEIILEESANQESSSMILGSEAGPHVRKALIYQWNGEGYESLPCEPMNPEDRALNRALGFLYGIHRGDDRSAYEQTMLPAFLGLEGLDSYDYQAFTHYIDNNVRPFLRANLTKGLFTIEQASTRGCLLKGPLNRIRIQLVQDKGHHKVLAVNIEPL